MHGNKETSENGKQATGSKVSRIASWTEKKTKRKQKKQARMSLGGLRGRWGLEPSLPASLETGAAALAGRRPLSRES